MATKSKKSDQPKAAYSGGLKFLALFLALFFAFICGIQVLGALRTNFYLQTKTKDVTKTPSFLGQYHDDIWALSNYARGIFADDSNIDFNSFCKEATAAKAISALYAREQKDALEIYNAIMELKKLQPASDAVAVTATSNNAGSYTVEDPNAETVEYATAPVYATTPDDSYDIDYDTNADEYYEYASFELSTIFQTYGQNTTGTVEAYKCGFDRNVLIYPSRYTDLEQWENDYRALRNVLFSIVNDATSEASIVSELSTEKRSVLADYYTTYYSMNSNEIENYGYHLAALKNFQYLVVNENTGKSVSNLPEDLSEKEFVSGLSESSVFSVKYEQGELLTPAAENDRSNALSNFLHESGFLSFVSYNEDFYFQAFQNCSVYIKVAAEPVRGDAYYNILTLFSRHEGTVSKAPIVLATLFAVLSVLSLVWLCRMSGTRKDGSVKLALTDRLLFVLHLAAVLTALIAMGALTFSCIYFDYKPGGYGSESLTSIAAPGAIAAFTGFSLSGFSLCLITFILYIVRNVKAGTFSRRFLLGLLGEAADKARKSNAAIDKTLGELKRKTYSLLGGYLAINLFYILLASFSDSGPFCALLFILFLIFNVLALMYSVRYVSDVLRLAGFAEEIRNGNFSPEIQPMSFCSQLRKFAEDLSACRDSIQKAVEEAVRGEKMKTELITNVSHDLKTPLTSIINYVTLLKMCDIKGEDERKYLEVLEDKARKLHRLIEDLTEASKATSGNVRMNIGLVNYDELALQAVGENSDVLESVGLETVYNGADEPIFVDADSQHTFRIIDNLFSNAKKYALTGTRVYVDVYREGNYGVFSMKNVSKAQLNIDPKELTERFVRGDNSRTTDGSGLGLSIARSLTEMQKGHFSLEIDGDLFKAVVKLPMHLFTEEEKAALDALKKPYPAGNTAEPGSFTPSDAPEEAALSEDDGAQKDDSVSPSADNTSPTVAPEADLPETAPAETPGN